MYITKEWNKRYSKKIYQQDMLITKDNRLKKLMQELKIGQNISLIESSLENINVLFYWNFIGCKSKRSWW